MTSGFGWRWGRMHEGIDIAVAVRHAGLAAAPGTVIHAGWLGGYGNLVVVDHGNGLATAYAHNSAYAVGRGAERSRRAQVIAYSGNTGNSTGPHVHFEVRVNGSAVDPLGIPAERRLGERAERRRLRRLRVDGAGARACGDDVQVGERAPVLVETEPVAGEELVRDGEADVAERDVVDEPPVRPVEQRHRGEAGRLAQRAASGRGSGA